MATNKTEKKPVYHKTLAQTRLAKGEAKDMNTGLMDIAEVRMLAYVVPIAIVLALFVYFITR